MTVKNDLVQFFFMVASKIGNKVVWKKRAAKTLNVISVIILEKNYSI